MAENKKATERRAQDPDAATEQAQQASDVETEQGFRGAEVDPTPNEHYTVEGVLAERPTPETDPQAADVAADAASAARSRFTER